MYNKTETDEYNREYCKFRRPPHFSLTTALQEKHLHIYKYFISPETRDIDVHFAADYMGLCLFVVTQIFFEWQGITYNKAKK